MGANKRKFSQEKLIEAWNESKMEGIRKLVGKTDIFFYADAFSLEVMKAYFENDIAKIEKLCSSNP